MYLFFLSERLNGILACFTPINMFFPAYILHTRNNKQHTVYKTFTNMQCNNKITLELYTVCK